MKIEFKNGSYINVIDTTKEESKRGKRAEFIQYLKINPSEYVYLTTGKKLSLWQRIWIDKILPRLEKK